MAAKIEKGETSGGGKTASLIQIMLTPEEAQFLTAMLAQAQLQGTVEQLDQLTAVVRAIQAKLAAASIGAA